MRRVSCQTCISCRFTTYIFIMMLFQNLVIFIIFISVWHGRFAVLMWFSLFPFTFCSLFHLRCWKRSNIQNVISYHIKNTQDITGLFKLYTKHAFIYVYYYRKYKLIPNIKVANWQNLLSFNHSMLVRPNVVIWKERWYFMTNKWRWQNI